MPAKLQHSQWNSERTAKTSPESKCWIYLWNETKSTDTGHCGDAIVQILDKIPQLLRVDITAKCYNDVNKVTTHSNPVCIEFEYKRAFKIKWCGENILHNFAIISQLYSPVLYTIGLLARNYPNHKSYVIISFTISPLIELYTTSYKTHTPNILFHYEKYTLLSTQSFSWYYWKEMVIKESSVIQFV